MSFSTTTTTAQNKNTIPEEFQLLDKYWRASNYLAVGQVCLCLFVYFDGRSCSIALYAIM